MPPSTGPEPTIVIVELWLIRHALPNREMVSSGGADPGLAEEGLDQARRLTEWWAPFGADALVTSPMRRARETAEPLAEALHLEPTVVDEVAEYDAHLPTYVPVEELMHDREQLDRILKEWMSPEAEAARQTFRDRVVEAIDGVVRRNEGCDRVVIVCHGGVINAYLSKVLGLPGTLFFEPVYTGVSRAIVRGQHRQFLSANEAPHLGRPRLPSLSI